MTPEQKFKFIVNNTNTQETIIREVYKDFDRRLFIWKAVNKELVKIPEIFKQFLDKLEKWKSDFLIESSFYPTRTSTQESLVEHEKLMNMFQCAITDRKQCEGFPDNLKKCLEDALGILLELELCLPTEEEIENGTV